MLITTPNLTRPDESYAALIATHEGLSEAESHALNARLILILMNHIGDHAVLAEAMRLARDPGAQAKFSETVPNGPKSA
ncbi:DUF2783 domain-containing protein [Tabrizicola thermarum]|uniref:DUF2783 domain-containing protein n=1 Tax=Tabrizicola thermarum TaxID=2670345 RepID=UPI000FFCAC7B|nr:DUF2783 domain-containing protein [Tabrizicola thermarum]